MDNPLAEYGNKKSIQELVEEFAVQMMVNHMIQVTGIEFSRRQDMFKLQDELISSNRVLPVINEPLKNVSWTSTGEIEFTVKLK